VEADLTARFVARAATAPTPGTVPAAVVTGLDETQQNVVAALAGDGRLLVIEGAAGAGKTTTLAAARTVIEDVGQRLVVVTPTKKAAQIAAKQLGTAAFSAGLAGAPARLAVGRARHLDPARRASRPRRARSAAPLPRTTT
jgi:exodeoxyribonuclease V alpha subunit